LKGDVKTLLAGLALVAFGVIAIASTQGLRASSNSAVATTSSAYHWLVILELISIWLGSLATAAAAIAFCWRMPPAKLLFTALAFLISAGAMSGISRAFVITTYAWIPIILPWIAAIFSGVLLFLVGTARLALSKRRL
jgi:hypothetical protein